MPNLKTFAAAPAVLAALSLTFTPAAAADMALPVAASPAVDAAPVVDIDEAQKAENHRYRRYHHRRGPSAGDVLTGVLIIGAVAAVANAAKREDRRDRDYRDRDYRDRDYRRDARYDDSRGIDRAVNICVDAVDRERRVETVDRVDRTADGWRVQGTITRGDPFLCRIDENGRDVDVDFPPRNARYDRDDEADERYEDIGYSGEGDEIRDTDDRQLDDERYASEWSKVDRGQPVVTAQGGQPAYPGGPVEGDATIDADLDVGEGYKGV